jgi:hypothetical protein
VQHTRFLWNPNYQLILFPYGVWLWARYWTTAQKRWLFLSGIAAGSLLLFHYQVVVVIGFLTILMLGKSRAHWQNGLFWFLGLLIGFSPMLTFEVRSHFYMIQTIFFTSQELGTFLRG